ncbi:MAG: DUF924 family protein [Rhizobiaceae bacterium]
MSVAPEEVLDYWIGIGAKKWWRRDDEVDSTIRERFGDTHAQAAAGKLDHWLKKPDSALALIIVLDQFSRNLNRNSALAFAQDTRCAHLVRGIMAKGLDERMRDDLRSFCYLPLAHAENPSDQERCIEEMRGLALKENIQAAEEHADIIRRFGRFPHRNDVLGRATTDDEQAYLNGGGFKG